MGYTTRFEGVLRFARDLTTAELRILNSILGEDCRDHPEWGADCDVAWIDLEITGDFSGLKWNGAEKSYFMEKQVNTVIRAMRTRVPDFALVGVLHAQGEDLEDRWDLVIGDDGLVRKVPNPPKGIRIECPHCRRRFYHEMPQDEKEVK